MNRRNARIPEPLRERSGWSLLTPRSTINRRDLFRLTFGGGAGLALTGLLDVPAVRAATKDWKLSDVSEFTTRAISARAGVV